MSSRWRDLRFGSLRIDRQNGKYLYRVEVHHGSIKPGDVQIELYANPQPGELPFREPMALGRAVVETRGVYEYSGFAPANRPPDYYTPRAVPRRRGLSVPLEFALIAWQK